MNKINFMTFFTLFSSLFFNLQLLSQENITIYNLEIIQLANEYPEAQGYDTAWAGSGVTEAIYFKGQQVLWASSKTYCTGFTFDIAMKIAKKYRLIENKSFREIRNFQQEWYCAIGSQGEEKGCVTAIINTGIGEEISWENAKEGDFIQFWRDSPKLSGHSAIFKKWIIEEGEIVGIIYKGSQKSTDGVGDKKEYFDRVVSEEKYPLDKSRFYIGRITLESN